MLLTVKDTDTALRKALLDNPRVQTFEDQGTHGFFIPSNVTEPLPLEEIEQSFVVDQKGSHEQTVEVINTAIDEALSQIEKGVACYGFIGRTAAHITYFRVAEHEGEVVINFRLSVAPIVAHVSLKQVYTLLEDGDREVFVNADATGATLRINGELVNFFNLEPSEDELSYTEQLKTLSMVLARKSKEPDLVLEHFASILKLI